MADWIKKYERKKTKKQIHPFLQMVERALDGVAGYLRYHGKLERYQQAGERWNFSLVLQRELRV